MLTTLRFLSVIFFSCMWLYLYVAAQNTLTVLQLEIPALLKELRSVQAQNTTLSYELERFENPVYLMELLAKPEFSHLRHPLLEDILQLEEPQP